MTGINPQNIPGRNPFDGLKIVARCPICKTEHNPMETAVLEEAGANHLLYVKCKNCDSGVVATLNFSPMGVASMGLVTDLAQDEVIKFKDASTVKAEDVLDIYQYLTKK